jgi:hypothetical protein
MERLRGLEEFWAKHGGTGAAGTLTIHEQVLLDTLGLGLEQTLQFLRIETPGFAQFLDWIERVAGAADPVAVARYHALLDGTPPPAETVSRLAAIDARPPALDTEAIAHWEKHGYVILRGAISAEEADAAAALLWSEVGARPDAPESWYGARLQGLMVQRFQHPALEAARRSPRVHKAFAQLWGTSDLWMRVDRMSFSAPERADHVFRAPRLHWDVSLVRPIPFATQGILYLTDTAEDQGALELVPGFHHRIDAWLDRLGDANPRQVDLSGEAVRVAAGAGDLIIWRPDLPHGASPNRSDRPRLAQYVNMYSPAMETRAEWR